MQRARAKYFPTGTPILVAWKRKRSTGPVNQPEIYSTIYEGPERRKGRRTLRQNKYRVFNDKWVAEAKMPKDNYADILDAVSAIEQVITQEGINERVHKRDEKIHTGLKLIAAKTKIMRTIRVNGKRTAGVFLGEVLNPNNGSIMHFVYCPSNRQIYWTSTRRTAWSEQGEQKVISRAPKQANWKNN